MMTQNTVKTIALAGCGLIGGHIAQAASDQGFARVVAVSDPNPEASAKIPDAKVLAQAPDLADLPVDLVIEAANAEVVKAMASRVLQKHDFLIFTVTPLADPDFEKEVRQICQKHQTRLFIPHGAILGLDGIHDGRKVLEEVSITTTKNPKNLGLSEPAEGVLYEGPTRGACAKFPRNVNVHAVVAAMGLGFDRTISRVVADPQTDQMAHEILVKGPGLEWRINISSRAMGAVTGSYTPESAAMTVRRILASDQGVTLA
jgi:aspartate dehydrogenase